MVLFLASNSVAVEDMYNMSMHNIKVGELNLIQERDRYFKFALRVE